MARDVLLVRGEKKNVDAGRVDFVTLFLLRKLDTAYVC